MDVTVKETISGENKNNLLVLSKNKISTMEPRKQRERHQNSSNTSSMLLALKEPIISSSSPQEGDLTFEPTIDMMVNDFDDEQTLNEEEALAEAEQQNPQDEISTLKEEGEMPLDELLAKYQALPCTTSHFKKKMKKKSKTHSNAGKKSGKFESDANAAEDVDDDKPHENTVTSEIKQFHKELSTDKDIDKTQEDIFLDLEKSTMGKLKHSYLLDLYPETLETKETCSLEDDELQSESDDEADTDPDYVKKTIMVGSAYQAVIPVGLSQYGDVLPYENEDKLIWEPSQVSEEEVEKYLLMSREIHMRMYDDETNYNGRDKANDKTMALGINISNGSSEQDGASVVKDNEQALHLLVQCGYDFKEALRRKRLNAVALSGSMSIWSDEECKNFEEGIQKYGKDFLRIRQTQVRTRSMPELVLFYYLWKKSERRDHEFANADTVDHMDMYLNENGGFGGNSGSANLYSGGFSAQSMLQQNGRSNSNSLGSSNTQKSISIMTTSQSSHSATNSLKIGKNHKRNGNVVSSFTSISVDNKQKESDFK